MKPKKILTIIVAIIFFVAVFLILAYGTYKVYRWSKAPKRFEAKALFADNQDFDAGDGLKIFAASSLDRIFKDGKTLNEPSFTSDVAISSAKNEYEPFQVAVYSSQEELAVVEFEISDLKNRSTGTTITRDNVSWRVVGYVPTQKPYYPVKYVGLWPDPLLPAQETQVMKNTVQPFWFSVYVPSDAVSGNYEGTIKVRVDDKVRKEIPLSVHVYDFVLPKTSRLKTAFDFYPHIMKDRYPQYRKESDEVYKKRINDLREKFILEMLKYRMNPILNIDPTNDDDLARVDRYLVYGLSNFSIGKKGGTFDNNWPVQKDKIEDLFMTYRTYGEMLKLNKLLPYTYIYSWDEKDLGNRVVPQVASMIHRAYPGLKNMVCYHGFWDPAQYPDWGKDIDIWCFQIDNYDEMKFRRLKNMGMEMWVYISGPGGYTTPNLAMDFDSIDYRIIPWLCWKYDIKGFLYWCVNWWVKADPFENASNTKWGQNANGLLFYPGKEGPVPSLRAEIFRDGMEDYEYIQILIDKLKTLKARKDFDQYKEFFENSVEILTVDDSIASTLDEYTREGEVLKARRDAIAERIEKIDQILSK